MSTAGVGDERTVLEYQLEAQRRDLAACIRSREIAAEHDLDEIFDWRGSPVSLRFVYAHLLTEPARHAGHGEILVGQLRTNRESKPSDA